MVALVSVLPTLWVLLQPHRKICSTGLWASSRASRGLDLWGKSSKLLHTHTHTHLTALYLRLRGWAGSRKVKSRFQKRKPNLDFTEARDNEWQWHQLGRMQVCNSLQTGNHASTSPLSFSRLDALPATQPTASKHWRQIELLQYWQLKAASLLPPLNNFSSCQIFPVLYN